MKKALSENFDSTAARWEIPITQKLLRDGYIYMLLRSNSSFAIMCAGRRACCAIITQRSTSSRNGYYLGGKYEI